MRREIERVVVENDVHLVCAPRYFFRSFRHVANLLVAIIVIESVGYCFTAQVSVGVAAMEPKISQMWTGNFIQIARHDRKMGLSRRINQRKGGLVAPEEIQRLHQRLALRPISVAQLHHQT